MPTFNATMKARRAGCVCLLAFALLIAGCARPTPTPEPVTIRFAVLDRDAKYYEALAKVYGRTHPNVTIRLLPRTPPTLDQVKPAEADVLFSAAVARRQQQGDLLSLDPWLAHDDKFAAADLMPGAMALFTNQGKTWAIPAYVDPTVMYYNRDLFDKYGVAYPKPGWTWDDFLATARSLREADPSVYGYASAARAPDPLIFILQHGGSVVDNLERPTRATLDDPLTVEAVERFAQFVREYDVAPSWEEAQALFGGDENLSVYRGIAGGRVGLWTGTYYEAGGRSWWSPWSFKWGIVTVPGDKLAATYAIAGALAISSQAAHPEACWDWISFLSQQMPADYAPARQSLLASAAYTQQVGDDNAAAVRAAIKDAQFLNGDFSAFEPFFQVFRAALARIMNGEASAAEAMSQAQSEAEKLVPSGG